MNNAEDLKQLLQRPEIKEAIKTIAENLANKGHLDSITLEVFSDESGNIISDYFPYDYEDGFRLDFAMKKGDILPD